MMRVLQPVTLALGAFIAVSACNPDRPESIEKDLALAATTVPAPPVVPYAVAEKWPIGGRGFGQAIVVAPENATEPRLRALGDNLRRATSGDQIVFVFSDPRAAALRGAALRDELTKSQSRLYDRHFVAVYNRNGATGHHALTITPRGLTGPQIDVAY